MKKIFFFLAAVLVGSWAMAQVPVTSITVNLESYDLEKGYTTTLKATVLPANATDPSIDWTSSDESKVKVDANGKLTYVSDGIAIIKATAKDGSGCKDSCTVYAGQYVYDDTKLINDFANRGTYTINTIWSTPVVHENQTFQIGSFSTHPEKAEKRIRITNFGAPKWSSEGVTIDIKWFPANDSLYIVNKQLIGKQNSSGYDLYIAGRGYFKSDAANTSHIDRATGTLYLDADYFYYKDPSSSTATTYTRKTDVFQLNELGGPVTSVTLNTHSIDLEKGYTTTLKATVLPANASNPSLAWTSSDESKVKVDANGKLTYVSDGIAIIKATAKDGSGCKDSCTVYTGQYVFDNTPLIDGIENAGTFTLNSIYSNPTIIKGQIIQVGTFSTNPEKAEKRIRITNFGAGSLSDEGVAIDIKWFPANDSLYVVNKQLIGKQNNSGFDIYVSGRGYFTSDGANTSHIDRVNGLLSIDADYFYYNAEGAIKTYTRKTDTLKLGITEEDKTMSYYKMDGALYIGTDKFGNGLSRQYLLAPYADSLAFVSQVGPGTWYLGKNHEVDTTSIGSDIYWMHAPSNVNKYVLYVPYFQSDINELYSEWQWGGVIKYRANARLRIGTGVKYSLCAIQYHPDSVASNGATTDMTMRSAKLDDQSIHYSYGSGVGTEDKGYYNNIGTYIHTNGVIWADSILVPIYNYSIAQEGADQDKSVIFGDKGKITLTIYSATQNEDGTPKIDREHPIYQTTATKDNFNWNGDTNKHKGSLVFCRTEKNPLDIEFTIPFISDGGDIYAEFSGFNESGMDFGFYSNTYPVKGQENGLAWFYKDGEYTTLWTTPHSIYLSFNGFFPFLKTMYGATQVNIDATGEEVTVIYPELEPEKQKQSDLLLRSNRDYGEWEYNDVYDWMELYVDTTDIWNSNNLTDITFIAEPNPGEERTDTLIFINHGVELRIPVIQEGTATGFINLYEKKQNVKVEKFIKNNNIYIRRNQNLFTIEGQKLE